MDESILNQLIKLVSADNKLELPPKVFTDMRGEFIEFIRGEKLVAQFPNMQRYMNPFGFMQGGIIVAAIDNTIAPLSYVSAPANITKEINTLFKRPIKTCDEYIQVVASVITQSTTHIELAAEVFNQKGKLAAKATANCVFVKGNRHS
jgi:uncharacterized protein (TIGR00369 family)